MTQNDDVSRETLRQMFEVAPDAAKAVVGDLRNFTIAINPECEPLPASCGPLELLEIEKRCGPMSGIVRRFATVDASYTECGHILEVLLKAGSPDSFPSRAEIDRWMLELGLGDVIPNLVPFLERVMGGLNPPATAQ